MTKRKSDQVEKKSGPPAVLAVEPQLRNMSTEHSDVLFALTLKPKGAITGTLVDLLNDAGLRYKTDKKYTAISVEPILTYLESLKIVQVDKKIWSFVGFAERDFLMGDFMGSDHFDHGQRLMKTLAADLNRFKSMHCKSREQREVLAKIAYYTGNEKELISYIDASKSDEEPVDTLFVFYPFNARFFESFAEKLQCGIIENALLACLKNTRSPDGIFGDFPLNKRSAETSERRGDLALLQGDFEDVQNWTERYLEWTENDQSTLRKRAIAQDAAWRGSMALMEGRIDQAHTHFEECIAATGDDPSQKQNVAPPGISGYFYQLALLLRGSKDDLKRVEQLAILAKGQDTFFSELLRTGSIMARSMSGENSLPEVVEANQKQLAKPPSIMSLFFCLAARQCGLSQEDLEPWSICLVRYAKECEHQDFPWLAFQAKALACEIVDKPNKAYELERLRDLLPFEPAEPLANLFTSAPEWEIRLNAIEAVAKEYRANAGKNSAKKKPESRKEVIWVFQFFENNKFEIRPMARSVSATGKATKGRNISMDRIKESPHQVEGITDRDIKVSRNIRKAYGDWAAEDRMVIDNCSAVMDLVGHPLVFKEEDKGKLIPVKVSEGRFQIDVTETKDGQIKAELKPPVQPTDNYGMLVHGPAGITIYKINSEVEKLQGAIGKGSSVTLPIKTKERFFHAVSTLAEKLDITAEGELTKDLPDSQLSGEDLVKIEGSPVVSLRLFPDGNGLFARLGVQPIPDCNHRFPPGEGRDLIFGIVDGQRVQATRDLKKEAANALWLVDNCPALSSKRGELPDLWSWNFPNPTSCLELLRDLSTMKIETREVVVEWPEDQPFKLYGIVSAAQFTGELGGTNEWLTVSGDLKVNDNLVISIRKLLDAATAEALKSGFLQLSHGQFIALTNAFARHLEDIKALALPGKSEEIKLPPLAALALEDFVGNITTKSKSKVWKEWTDRLRQAQDHTPNAPKNLQAELRPYQLDGYRWMSRLALSGAGACLADDMGLGKTVQTIGLLLERAEGGPALVVAPTSVAANWVDELVKFSPTLQIVIFGQGDRAKQLASLQPYDVVICTYGLLQRESEALAGVRWHTVVLDEAQAIKNSAAQRTKAARSLEADFRIVTTGTPIENRLSELHTLFQFILPGYLGSKEKFRANFADPIEKYQDASARDRLKRLVQPFILRRLKSGVLKDLPSRTEINIHVELDEKQTAFYEALRQKAVAELEESASEGAPGQQAFQILAELTKLRRACCHPVLADRENGEEVGSAKLAAFSETVVDILAGNHKVLIFSQFVDHLTLIREELDRNGITYQYLDGSTPTPKRKAACDAFQRGESDAFLISLKAGGCGLNLTAADYVIHMDPWWNPAAEDQASDRAHRIGQTRPVTIYRFITKNTIEEKIVALHQQKRELAESLLTGTDLADGRISPEELMKLLRE